MQGARPACFPQAPAWGAQGKLQKNSHLPYREAEPVGRRASILRNEAYLWYVGMTKDEAQHRRWTFYEAVNFIVPSAQRRLWLHYDTMISTAT